MFRQIRDYVDREAKPRAEAIVNIMQNQELKSANKGMPDPAYKNFGTEQKRIDSEMTNALWATYYFAQRDIRAAMPTDKASVRQYQSFAGRHKIYAGDPSKRFAADKVVLEHNTVRLSSQIMPTPAKVAKLRRQSAVKLAA